MAFPADFNHFWETCRPRPPLTPERAAGRPSSVPRWSDAAPQVLGTPPPSPRRDRREEVKRKSREQKEAAEAWMGMLDVIIEKLQF